MSRGRVILADRHQEMLEGIRGLLETMFEVVVMVADEDSLCDAAAKLNSDLAVVDLSLPASGGVNIVRQVKNCFPDLKLVILSIHDDTTAVKQVMAMGAEGFVLKRSAATDLVPAVRAVLKGRKYVSPMVKKELRQPASGETGKR